VVRATLGCYRLIETVRAERALAMPAAELAQCVSRIGDGASVQAVTRVNAKQASVMSAQEDRMFDPKELLNTLTGVQGAPAGGILQNALAQAKSGLDAAAGGDVRQRVAGALNQGAAMAGEAASQTGKVLSGALSQVEGQLQGTQAGAMLDRAKEVAQQNPMATGAALGGIATVLLGTQTGRAVAGDMRSISTRRIGTKG
jgi:hypothetical protein